jgi:O-antigen ligase
MKAGIAAALMVTAVLAGIVLAMSPVLGSMLTVLLAVVITWATVGRAVQLVSVILVVTIAGLYSGLLNPGLVSPEVLANAATLKWVPFLLPVAAALIFSARTRQLALRPNNWPARFFLLFMLWTGMVLVLRVGLDGELLFKWASVLLIYFYAFGVIPALIRPNEEEALLQAFAVIAGIVAVTSLGTLVFATGDALSMGRLTGSAFNALTLAMFCTLGALTFGTLGFHATGSMRTLAHFAAAAVCAGLLLLTGGRASVIALFLGAGTLLFGMFSQRKMRVALAVPASVIAGVFLLVMAIQLFGIRLDQGLFREKGGESVRLELILDAGRLLAQDPLTLAVGTGFGVVRKTYYAHLGIGPETDLTVSYRDTFAKLLHNSYLEVLVETGIVGAILLLCAIGSGLRQMRRMIRGRRSGSGVLGYGCLGIVVAGLVESAFNSVLLAPGGALGIWLWSILGVYAALVAAQANVLPKNSVELTHAAA